VKHEIAKTIEDRLSLIDLDAAELMWAVHDVSRRAGVEAFLDELDSIVMDTWMPALADLDRRVVARYADDDVLMSGWLIGEERIAGKAAVVDVQRGRGRILLIGIRVPYRAQAHGTYKLLLNSLLYPRAAEPQTSSGSDLALPRP